MNTKVVMTKEQKQERINLLFDLEFIAISILAFSLFWEFVAQYVMPAWLGVMLFFCIPILVILTNCILRK